MASNSPSSPGTAQPIDPYDVFQHARCFLETAKITDMAFQDGHLNQFRPSIVLLAFVVELLLKCLFYDRKTGFNPPQRHDAIFLFSQLDPADKRVLKKYFDASAKNDSLVAEVLTHQLVRGIKVDIESVLKRCDNLFDAFRYAFEGIDSGTDDQGFRGPFGIHNLIECLLKLIAERHPDWEYRFRLMNLPTNLLRPPLNPHP